MHACAVLLEEAFSILAQEEQAIADEDLARLGELSSQRSELLRQAWEQRDGYDEDELRGYLLRMENSQKQLLEAAEVLHDKYREQQRNGRKQAKYLQSDQRIQAELQKSFYCDKVS